MSLLLIDSNEGRALTMLAGLRRLGWIGHYKPTLEAAVGLLHRIPRPINVVLAWSATIGVREAVRVLVEQPQQIRPEVVVVLGGPKELREALNEEFADCCVLPGFDPKEVVRVLDLEVEA